MEYGGNKLWAKEYLLDPLYGPEPSQETGPGSSHYNQTRAAYERRSVSPQHTIGLNHPASIIVRQMSASSEAKGKATASIRDQGRRGSHSDSLTPPGSGSPANRFSSSNRDHFSAPSPSAPASAVRNNKQRPSSSASNSSFDSITNLNTQSILTPPETPPSYYSALNLARKPTPPRPSSSSSRHSRQSSSVEPAERPLAMIKNHNRAAERYHRHRRHVSDVDMIDALDTIGGTYHHGGPYDATLISRNLDKKYSPVAAVHDSNMEALRATPKEFIADSLTRHMPLQGVATIPSGGYDMRGQRISYNEGADLMREPDAAGGAYKRWDGVKYHPGDLKGKGEPSYTLEKALKQKKRAEAPDDYEMQANFSRRHGAGKRPPIAHQRSVSEASVPTRSSHGRGSGSSNAEGSELRRQDSTGKKLGDGLRRRFGSLRKKTSDAK